MARKILVIEDDEDTRQLLKEILEKNGYDVLIAKNGKDGIETSIEKNPDVILMDLNLPFINGIDASISIISRRPESCIIIMSANQNVDQMLKEHGLSLPVIEKPFDIDELIGAIEKTKNRCSSKK